MPRTNATVCWSVGSVMDRYHARRSLTHRSIKVFGGGIVAISDNAMFPSNFRFIPDRGPVSIFRRGQTVMRGIHPIPARNPLVHNLPHTAGDVEHHAYERAVMPIPWHGL